MKTVNKMPRYSAYKDSDYQWIGNIPEKWNIQKLSSCLFPVSEKNRPSLPLLSITRELGVIERDIKDQDKNHNFIPDDLTNYKLLKKGQFGMNKMKAWQGSYGISNYTGIVSPAYFVFDLTKNIETEFFNWAIRSSLYVSYFGSASDGVRIGQWDLSKTRMKSIPFLIPSKNEQIAIVNFLDQKAAQIDQAIAIKQKQIELLKERQQIIIQQAVTKGLDPNVPMKDSGIEWIGIIPEHWNIKKLKYFTQFINRGCTPNYIIESEYKVINQANFSKGFFDFDNVKYTRETEYSYKNNRGVVVLDDLLLASTGGGVLGKVAHFDINTQEKYIADSHVTIIRTDKQIAQNKFYYYFLVINFELINGILAQGATNQTELQRDWLINLFLPLPPLEEQQSIVKYLDGKVEQFNKLILLETLQIEKLKEYKTTLIDGAVTGKIKITPEK